MCESLHKWSTLKMLFSKGRLKLARDRHSSLYVLNVSDEEKRVCKIGTCINLTKHFLFILAIMTNKLECLCIAILL
jgi:hypothetical protein